MGKKVDEYLLREHRLMAGACSSIESLKYLIGKEVFERLFSKFKEKVASAAFYSDWSTKTRLYDELVEFIKSFEDER